VNHGYQQDVTQTITDHNGHKKKSSSSTRKKRSELEKIADQSLAELAPPLPSQEILKDNNNNNDDADKMIDDSFTANARKIFHSAGNNMMSTLPTTTSAAYTYQNVYDTFQKYYEPEEALYEDEEAAVFDSTNGGREGGERAGFVRNVENGRSTGVVASSPAAQVTTKEATTIDDSPAVMSGVHSDAVVYREPSDENPNEVGEEIDHYQLYQQQQQHGHLTIDTTATTTPVDTTDNDVLQIEDKSVAVAEATRSPSNKKVELFKKLRQRRRRKRTDSDSRSPIRRTSSAPQHTSSISSPVSSSSKFVEGSKEKTVVESSNNNNNTAAELQQRYSRNIHTRMMLRNDRKNPDPEQEQDPDQDPTRKYGVQQFSNSELDKNDTIKKKEEVKEGDVAIETVERREDQESSRCNNAKEENPTDILDIVSMQTCTYSWATPPEEEESLRGSMDENEEFSSVQQQSTHTNNPSSVIDDDKEEEEEEGELLTEEVLPSTSSGMSESLVGSDMDDDEEPLGCLSFNSMEELEEDETSCNIYNGVDYDEDDDQDDDDNDKDNDTENVLLESFDNNEFPHTELEVIEEGSREETEEHTRNLAFFNNNNVVDTVLTTDSGEFSIDECLSSNNFEEKVHENNNRDVLSEESSLVEGVEPLSEERIRSGSRHSFFSRSIYGLLKVVFTLVLMLQCCIVIDTWDHVTDHVKSIDGGPYVIATLEDIAMSLKSKGISLSATVNDIVNIEKIVTDMISNLKTRGGSFLAASNDLIKLEPTQEGIVKLDEEELSQGDQSVTNNDLIKLESAGDFVKFIEEDLSQVDDHRWDDIDKSVSLINLNEIEIFKEQQQASAIANNESKENTEDNSVVAPDDPRKVTTISTEPPPSDDDELRLFQQLVEEALGPIDNEIKYETVVKAVVPPSIVMDDTTTPMSDWVQELEDSCEV